MATILAQKILVGNVAKVYDLREVGKQGSKVLDFSVAVTPRRKEGEEWVDGETLWNNVTVWNRTAENVAASLKPGDRVIVVGRADVKAGYTNKEGVEVPAREIVIADFVGLDLTYHPAESKRESNKSGGGSASVSATSRPSQPAPKKEEPKEANIFEDDDFDFDNDDDTPPF